MQRRESAYFEGPGNFMRVRHLKLRGSNFEIGQEIGKLAAHRHGRSVNDFLADAQYVRARRSYLQQCYPIQWERVRGVADALGVDAMDDRYDLGSLTYNLQMPGPPIGCSVVYYPPGASSTGHGYLSRNYDFPTGTMADLLRIPVPPEVNARLSPVMREPYIMEWHPDDGGYASLAIHAFELLSGTLDGINSEGLVVSIMADEEAIAELGPHMEQQLGPQQAIGLHELQVMRLLLDTCATVDQAKLKLLTVKQYYFLVPCHYIVADKAGNSFVYENSTGRNVQHIVDGGGNPQVVTNFQLHKHPRLDAMPGGPLTVQTNAFWRYRTIVDRIAGHHGPLTPEELKANNACVNIYRLIEAIKASPSEQSVAAGIQSRTLWHSLYDQQAGQVEISFYLGEDVASGGAGTERRSEYMTFKLDPRSA